MSDATPHPRERFITIYGRMPVLEALRDDSLQLDKVLLADNARGANVTAIRRAAEKREIPVHVVGAQRVKLLAGNGRHDQGVAADVIAPRMSGVDAWIAQHSQSKSTHALLLDGVTNPSNVGMVIRAGTAAGLAGIILPRAGTAEVGPLVIKASAGVAFQAPIVRARSSAEAIPRLREAGFAVVGLDGEATDTVFDTYFADKTVFVLGNETEGLSPAAAQAVTSRVSIPLAAGVESLNVATAAAVLAYELLRRERG